MDSCKCPRCGRTAEHEDQFDGKDIECPYCHEPIRTSPFEPFYSEVDGYLGGLHDGENAAFALGHVADEMVHRHEMVHDELFSLTPDGHLLSILRAILAEAGKQNHPSRETVRQSVAALLQQSKDAHEAVATYAGVKALPISRHAAAQDRFPRRYRNYYDLLNSVVTPLSQSSYWHYLVALNIGLFVFSSRILDDFAKQGPERPLSYRVGEGPSDRLARVRRVLEQKGGELVSEIDRHAQEVGSRRGFPVWDLHSEQAWIDNAAFGTHLELALAEPIWAWLRSETQLPYLPYEEAKGIIEEVTPLLTQWGIQATGTESVAGLPPRQYARIRRATATLISNHGVKPPPPVDDTLFANLETHLITGGELSITSSEFPNRKEDWYVHASPAGKQALWNWVFGATRARVASMLGQIARSHAAGEPTAALRQIGITVADAAGIAETVEAVVKAMGSGFAGAAVLNILRSCRWYWTGSWAEAEEWAQRAALRSAEPPRIWTIFFSGPKAFRTSSVPEESSSVVELDAAPDLLVKLLLVPGVPGLVMRVLSFRAAAELFRLEDRLLEQGCLRFLEEERRRAVSDAAAETVMTLLNSWSRF